MEALSNAIAQMGRRLDNQDSDNQNGGSVSRNHELETGSTSRNNRTEVSNGGTTGGIQTQFSRVDFPQFNGENPTGWIYKAEKFFRYQSTADNEKVLLASFNLQDDALQWYQWFEKKQTDVSLEDFMQALCVRFGPSDYKEF